MQRIDNLRKSGLQLSALVFDPNGLLADDLQNKGSEKISRDYKSSAGYVSVETTQQETKVYFATGLGRRRLIKPTMTNKGERTVTPNGYLIIHK